MALDKYGNEIIYRRDRNPDGTIDRSDLMYRNPQNYGPDGLPLERKINVVRQRAENPDEATLQLIERRNRETMERMQKHGALRNFDLSKYSDQQLRQFRNSLNASRTAAISQQIARENGGVDPNRMFDDQGYYINRDGSRRRNQNRRPSINEWRGQGQLQTGGVNNVPGRPMSPWAQYFGNGSPQIPDGLPVVGGPQPRPSVFYGNQMGQNVGVQVRDVFSQYRNGGGGNNMWYGGTPPWVFDENAMNMLRQPYSGVAPGEWNPGMPYPTHEYKSPWGNGTTNQWDPKNLTRPPGSYTPGSKTDIPHRPQPNTNTDRAPAFTQRRAAYLGGRYGGHNIALGDQLSRRKNQWDQWMSQRSGGAYGGNG